MNPYRNPDSALPWRPGTRPLTPAQEAALAPVASKLAASCAATLDRLAAEVLAKVPQRPSPTR